MLGFIAFSVFLSTALWWIFRFATADADLTLLSKGQAKRHEVEDKVVWITGASQGIGEVLAKEFAHLGAKLILSSRRESELERVKAGLSGKNVPEGVMILPLDLTAGANAIREAVLKAESLFSGAGVDYMVHNAAHERPKMSALDSTEESLQATFDVNVMGTITLTRHLAPFMLKRGRGHFVVMSSAAGKVPAPGQAIYAASKYAVNGYFDTLRCELGHKGIKVTIICPGPIQTSTSSSVATTTAGKAASQKRVSAARCAELTIVATTHGLKEVWISHQPILSVMYLVQYLPSLGYALMEKKKPLLSLIYNHMIFAPLHQIISFGVKHTSTRSVSGLSKILSDLLQDWTQPLRGCERRW